MKWHIAAKAGGAGDPQLDEYMGRQTREDPRRGRTDGKTVD